MLKMIKAIGKQIRETRSKKRAASRPELNPHVVVDFNCCSITYRLTNFSSGNPCNRKCHVKNPFAVLRSCGFYVLCSYSWILYIIAFI